MVNVTSYNSLEEMGDAMDKALRRANAAVRPAQAAIGYGDYWAQIAENEGLVVFGRIWTIEEGIAASIRCGADEEEAAWEARWSAAQHAEGFRFGIAYSVACPEGELGSTHIVDMVPITKEVFEAAQANGWAV